MRWAICISASWRISCINNEQRHPQHLACGETFLTYGLCSGLEQTASKQVTSWRAHDKVLPITELVLVLLNGCAWLVSHCHNECAQQCGWRVWHIMLRHLSALC